VHLWPLGDHCALQTALIINIILQIPQCKPHSSIKHMADSDTLSALQRTAVSVDLEAGFQLFQSSVAEIQDQVCDLPRLTLNNTSLTILLHDIIPGKSKTELLSQEILQKHVDISLC